MHPNQPRTWATHFGVDGGYSTSRADMDDMLRVYFQQYQDIKQRAAAPPAPSPSLPWDGMPLGVTP